MRWLFLMVFAYLVGSIPTGLLVARLTGAADPRKAGSGNIGATNVGRTSGQAWGALTLAGDAFKGYLPTVWALAAFSSPWAVVTVALAAYLGHLFPVYLQFKGGKGVATGLGVFLALAPGGVFWAAVVFGFVAWKGGRVSLASLTASAVLPLLLAFFDYPFAAVVLAVVVAAGTFFTHGDNLDRLLDQTERRFGQAA